MATDGAMMAERRDGRLTAKEFQQAGGTEDWRFLALGASAWFAAPSHAAGAELVRRVAEIGASIGHVPAVDLRATGVHVRTFSPDVRGPSERDVEVARAVSSAARELGLAADPTAVQAVNLTIDALDRRAVMPFWAATLAYEQVGDEDLLDPLGRHPGLWFQQMDVPRPLRNRVHLDVGVPHEVATVRVTAAEAAGGRVRYVGPEWRTLADPEGNEVDVLPVTDGDPFTGAGGVEDWRVMLDASVWYPAPYEQGAELCVAAARVADEIGVGLLVDLRPSGVAVSTGKDRWATPPYRALARGVQEAARALGLAADLAPVRDLQLTIDAVDVPAVQDFWIAALGYARAHDADPRASEADLYDPRRLNPPLCFQQMDPDDEARRAQRNRIHVDVFVPDDQAEARIAAALEAGGRIVYDAEAPEWWTIADPEGNEVDIAVSVGREELWAAQRHDVRGAAEHDPVDAGPMDDRISAQEFHDADGTQDWKVVDGAAQATFATGSFAAGVELVDAIGELAEAANHHPDVDLRYPAVTVRLMSHDVDGISRRDVALARRISDAARELDIPVSR